VFRNGQQIIVTVGNFTDTDARLSVKKRATLVRLLFFCVFREVDENPGSSSRSAYYFLSHTIVVTFMVNM
jgi:hypothetical protein